MNGQVFVVKDTWRDDEQRLEGEFYQYIGPAIETFLSDLKPVQVKELKEAFEALEKEGKGRGSVKPERLTRQGARDAEAAADAGGDADVDVPAEEGAWFHAEHIRFSQCVRTIRSAT